MSVKDEAEYWKKRVVNPDALGGAEKAIWTKLEPILNELLDELKANGKIEIVYTRAKTDHIQNIINNLNIIAINHNLLSDISKDMENVQKFLEATAPFGFTDGSSTHLWVEVTVLQIITNLEIFKTLVLAHLRDVDLLPSHFPSTIRQNAPNAWMKLEPYVENKFRNSLAHGTWSVEDKKVVLFGGADLIPFAKMSLAEFWIKSKEINLLYSCFGYVLNEKIKANFFT